MAKLLLRQILESDLRAIAGGIVDGGCTIPGGYYGRSGGGYYPSGYGRGGYRY